jgi:hypothetical protein
MPRHQCSHRQGKSVRMGTIRPRLVARGCKTGLSKASVLRVVKACGSAPTVKRGQAVPADKSGTLVSLTFICPASACAMYGIYAMLPDSAWLCYAAAPPAAQSYVLDNWHMFSSG